MSDRSMHESAARSSRSKSGKHGVATRGRGAAIKSTTAAKPQTTRVGASTAPSRRLDPSAVTAQNQPSSQPEADALGYRSEFCRADLEFLAIVKRLIDEEWKPNKRGGGSHCTFTHPEKGLVSVPKPKGKYIKRGTYNGIAKQAGWKNGDT